MPDFGTASTDALEKRPRVDATTSQELIAAVAQAVTKAFMSSSNMAGNGSRAPSSNQRGSNKPARGGKQGGNKYQGGSQRNFRRTEYPKRMCEKCAMINPDHEEGNCPNPPDPNIAAKLAKHKKYCNDLRKKFVRERINKASSGSQQLPGNTSTQHTAHLAAASVSEVLEDDDPAGSLYLDDDADSFWVPDHDLGYSAVHGSPPSPPASHGCVNTMLLLIGTLCIAATSMAVIIPSFLGLPGFVLPAGTVLTTFLLANFVLLLLSVCAPFYTWTPAGSSSPCSYKLVPRQFAVVLLFLCLGFAFSGHTQGYAFTSQHNLTASDSDHRCWVDSACTKSIFRSKHLLVNVRKLSTPHNVGGIGSRIITAHWQGDYPLVLRAPSGRIYLKLIKNVLISPHTGANLLGTNCLNAADIGFDAPPAWRCASAKLYIQDRDGTRDDFTLPKVNGLWSVPDFRHVGFAEIPQSIYAALLSKDAPRSHQLRPLTEAELWHLRLNHAHPSKLAKLSRNCVGIKHPLPDVRHPCHSCQDSNATRNDAPPPSVSDPEGVWHVDVMDIGEKHVSLAGYRYVSVFTIAKSRFTYIELHKTKDAFLFALQRVIARAGCKPTILRSDGAGEYFTEPVNRYLIQERIKKESSNAREQFGNGRAETLINALGKGMRVSLYDSGLPFEFWGFAAINWTDVYNHLPHAALQGRTPWEVQYGTLPDVSWFRPFGCRVTVFRGRDEVSHHKLAPRGEACVYVGLGFYSGHKGWLCWSPRLKRLFCTRHCRFDKTFMPMRTHDQRILGFYDTTPRSQMLADQYGDPAVASGIHDELNDLPLPFEPEELDIPDQSRHEQPFFHPEANHFMDPSALPKFPGTTPVSAGSNQPSGGNLSSSAATASGGRPASSATTASGGRLRHPLPRLAGAALRHQLPRLAGAHPPLPARNFAAKQPQAEAPTRGPLYPRLCRRRGNIFLLLLHMLSASASSIWATTLTGKSLDHARSGMSTTLSSLNGLLVTA